MFFSLVIPTFNRANLIERTLRSAVAQTFHDFEIIVVDDGSTDNTEDIIKDLAHPRIRYFRIANSERGAARNFGVREARGQYISFLDSDDILLPNYFQNASESLARYNYPPFFHLGYEIIGLNEKKILTVDFLKNDEILFLVRGNPLSCTGCFMKKEVALQYPFNEDRKLAGSEDWELWFRVLANNGIKTDNRISARMHNHDERSINTQAQEEKLVNRKELALAYAFKDNAVQHHYGPYYKEIDAFGDSYIALHLALMRNRRRSIHYLLRFVKNYPAAVFTRRFVSILKCLIVN